MDRHPEISGVLVQVCETSTGVMHPVGEIAAVARKHGALLVADGISAVGVSPAPMDEWGLDCLLTGSQKGLMVPPGLALLALSAKAWRKAEKVAPSCYYFNLPAERAGCLKNQTPFTPPVSLILGLREALRMIFEIGLPLLYRKHRGLARMARAGVSALGLELFAPEHFAWGLTSIRMPAHMPASPIVKKAAAECGVILTTGQEPMKDEIIRLAHMGWVDWADLAAGLHALAWSLPEKPASPYLEPALDVWHQAMDDTSA
jgi:aspartate aminotransferase-like enzyme